MKKHKIVCIFVIIWYNHAEGQKRLDYKDFTLKDEAYAKFLQYRKQIIDNADNGEFNDAFLEVSARAIDGDCVAQDCIAYFFKRGFDDFKPNYEYYMSWEVLAAANGNEFAIEKLQFFLDVAVNTIIYDRQILKTAMLRKNINKTNAISVISNLICEESLLQQWKTVCQELLSFWLVKQHKTLECQSFLQRRQLCLQ